MTHKILCFSAVLVSCCALSAQTPAPGVQAPSASVPNPTPTVVQAGIATNAGPDIQEIQRIEDKWSDAVNNRDQYQLELVLSPLFIDISASGDITTRNQTVADVISGQDKTVHIEQRVITVRMLGDIAVANGTYLLHHKAGNVEVDEKGVFTHVFERLHNGWVCVNSQRTVLRQDLPNGKKKKPSEAELPFHIPFLSRGEKQ